jgi:hypothetical protein
MKRRLAALLLLGLFAATPAGTAQPGVRPTATGDLEEFRPAVRLPVGDAIAFPADI